MTFYNINILPEIKQDGSPITLADKLSHKKILDLLSITNIPIISEEGGDQKVNHNKYWLIDPLDGTKDFLAVNDEFTVNIALIENNRPILGVVYAPALNEMYTGIVGKEAYFDNGIIIKKSRKILRHKSLVMATSRFHNHSGTDLFAESNNIKKKISIGSALKFCRMAFGEIDVYPRLVGTSEWDTAAGQAILEAAGGSLMDWHTGEPVLYGKNNMRNGMFIAYREPYNFQEFIYQKYNPGSL